MLYTFAPTTVFPCAAAEERALALIEAHDQAMRAMEEDFMFASIQDDLDVFTPCVVPQEEAKEVEQHAIFASLAMAQETAVDEDGLPSLFMGQGELQAMQEEEEDEEDVAYRQWVAQIVHEEWLKAMDDYERECDEYPLEGALEGKAVA